MHPYREMPMRTDHPSNPRYEELIVYGLLLLVGAIPIWLAVAHREFFGVDATLGVLMSGAGTVGVIAHAVQARRGPAAAPRLDGPVGPFDSCSR
jgi:hypothetical protein